MLYDTKTRKKIFLLLIIIFCIVLLIFTTYRRSKTLREGLEKISSSSKKDLGFPEAIDYDSLLNQKLNQEEEKEEAQEEFVSQDGNFIINYPSSWDKAQESELSSLGEAMLLEKAKFIFIARKAYVQKASVAFLMVQEIERDGKSLSEIVEESRTQAEQEGEAEIINSQINEEDALLEIRYEEKRSLRLKEKFLLDNQKVYLVIIVSLEESWGDFRESAEEIIASARLVK